MAFKEHSLHRIFHSSNHLNDTFWCPGRHFTWYFFLFFFLIFFLLSKLILPGLGVSYGLPLEDDWFLTVTHNKGLIIINFIIPKWYLKYNCDFNYLYYILILPFEFNFVLNSPLRIGAPLTFLLLYPCSFWNSIKWI